MKLKRILCLLLLFAMALTLGGCAYLDDLRAQQAYLIDGNVHWNGVVYKRLPESGDFSPSWGFGGLNVTKPDVPVLLSDSFREFRASVSDDCLFLGEESYYCREDVYDYWAARMTEPFEPQAIGFYYYYWDERTQEGGDQFYVFTEEQVKVMDAVLDTVEPMVIGEGWSLDYGNRFGLEYATEDLMFRRSAQIDLAQAGSQYYLIDYRLGKEEIYQVPAEHNAIFAALFDNYSKYW